MYFLDQEGRRLEFQTYILTSKGSLSCTAWMRYFLARIGTLTHLGRVTRDNCAEVNLPTHDVLG